MIADERKYEYVKKTKPGTDRTPEKPRILEKPEDIKNYLGALAQKLTR